MFTCIGFVAPEYAMCGYFSVKFDVFSFGVLVLEIITGQKNRSFAEGENVEGLLSSMLSKCNYFCLHFFSASNCDR
jgi:hypothetical protein